MDVARMNFSHGDYADHKAAYDRVRAACDATGRAVGVLADLQGPKIRLGRFATGSTYWADGETVRITVAECQGSHDRVSTTYKKLVKDAVAGDRVLVDDGKVGLVVDDIDGDDVVCTVTEGGPVSNNKGISLPGMNVSAPALSDKDIEDLTFALNLGVDLVALSFVIAGVFLSIGAVAGLLTESRTQAFGVSLCIWFFFVLFYDLAVIGLAFVVRERLANVLIFVSLFGNPVDLARVSSLLTLGDPAIFGAAGAALLKFLGGAAQSYAALALALAAWLVGPLVLAARILRRIDL